MMSGACESISCSQIWLTIIGMVASGLMPISLRMVRRKDFLVSKLRVST
jgi:hypothetical protein